MMRMKTTWQFFQRWNMLGSCLELRVSIHRGWSSPPLSVSPLLNIHPNRDSFDSKGVGDHMILFSILLIGFLIMYIWVYIYVLVESCWWKKFCTFLVKLRCSAAQRHCAPHWACYFWSWTPRGRKGVGKLWFWWSTWWVTRANFPYSTGNGKIMQIPTIWKGIVGELIIIRLFKMCFHVVHYFEAFNSLISTRVDLQWNTKLGPQIGTGIAVNGSQVVLQTWDFAGQEMYYNMAHVFLEPQSFDRDLLQESCHRSLQG